MVSEAKPPMQLKVLVFDDQATVVDALSILFDVHDIPVVTANTRSDVLRLIAGGEIGAVIQDMNFSSHETSGEEGIALFRRIRQADARMPVLLITAWASLETAVRLIKEGATDYMAKPWDDDRLVHTVRNLLEMRRLQLENDRFAGERARAREAIADAHDLCGLVYESDAMHRVLEIALNVADSDAPVLVSGPSGAGKEKIAEIVLANSPRREEPFVRVNLGALPENLMEAELFGAEAGAFTGAEKRREGRFEAADGGTLFLDEIDSLSLAGQVKLLRVLQSGEFQRLGSSTNRRADVRIISATNADLEAAVAEGRFREDLYYRLNVIELRIPPLAARRDDVLPLARHFLKTFAIEGAVLSLTRQTESRLRAHDWPGNVRELENRCRRAILVARDRPIEEGDLDIEPTATPSTDREKETPGPAGAPHPSGVTGERRRIEEALVRSDGVVARAAEDLGLSRQALYRRMSRLGIELERRPRP